LMGLSAAITGDMLQNRKSRVMKSAKETNVPLLFLPFLEFILFSFFVKFY